MRLGMRHPWIGRNLAALILLFGLTLWRPASAQALIPVVPFISQDQIELSTGSNSCGTSCQTSLMTSGADTALSLSTPNALAKGSITLPTLGLPDLSAGVTLAPGVTSQAMANYINTITFTYTGTGPAPSSLSSSLTWTVNASMPSGNPAPLSDFGGNASIEVSTSTCYCPLVGVYATFTQSGSQTMTDPFTVGNGGSIAYGTTLQAYAYGSTGLTGTVSLDPALLIGLPAGWTATLGSGGTLGALPETPEPSTLWLFASGLLLLALGRNGRYKEALARIVRR